jgi:cytochrome c553
VKVGVKRWLIAVVFVLVGMGLLGFLVAASGIVPMKASSGHWAVTEALLQFAKRRSIATHSLKVNPPREFAAWQVVKGAGHYETGCRPCHGAPDVRSPVIVNAMLPDPPYLSRRVRALGDAKLFYIVRHGLKFTGMPAWPSPGRDDEVWAVVAFLGQLPDLDATAYRKLVDGDISIPRRTPPLEDLNVPADVPGVVVASCARCHGLDGEGRGNAAFPKLAGQKPDYLLESLRAYSDRRRHSGIMGPIAYGLSDDDRALAVSYYSRLQRGPVTPAPDETTSSGDASRGETIAREGLLSRGVPPCIECHGPGPERNALYPELAGQYAGYLELQLELFRKGVRGGTPFAHLMQYVATRLDEREIRDIAAWYASLDPTRGR